MMLLNINNNILATIFVDHLLISDISTFGCLSKKVNDEFWLILQKKLLINNQQSSKRLRSTSSPRQFLFKTIRLARLRFHHSMYIKTRMILDETDSPTRLKKLYKDFGTLENYLLIDLNLGELMIYACYKERWNCVKYFISQFNVDKNYKCKEGNATALIISSWLGNIQFVKWLFNLCDTSPLDVLTEACLNQTSSCGSPGPHNAYEWARRKAEVCSNSNFRKCELYLKKRMH